jgi:hypothetical protein
MKKLIFFAVLVLAYNVQAQTLNQTALQQTDLNNLTPSTTINTWDYTGDDLIGTRYLTDNYLEGELWTTNKTHYTTELTYRFDEVDNAVQIKFKDSGKEVVLFNEKVAALQLNINNKKISFLRIPEVDKENPNSLYQLIVFNEKYKVVKFAKKRLVVSSNEDRVFEPAKNTTEYKEDYHYYVKLGDKEYAEFKLSKKGLLKAFPRYTAKIEEILKLPKYNKKITDAIMIDVIDSIQKEKTTN